MDEQRNPSVPFASSKNMQELMILLVGTVLGYVFYWIAVIVVLVYMKFREVLFTFCRKWLPSDAYVPGTREIHGS
jgi:hypothetical protein